MSPYTVLSPSLLHPESGETDLPLLFASAWLSFPDSNDNVDWYARHDDGGALQLIPLDDTRQSNPEQHEDDSQSLPQHHRFVALVAAATILEDAFDSWRLSLEV